MMVGKIRPMSDNIKVITRHPEEKYSYINDDGETIRDSTLEKELNALEDRGFDIVTGGCGPDKDIRGGTRLNCTFILKKNLEKLSR